MDAPRNSAELHAGFAHGWPSAHIGRDMLDRVLNPATNAPIFGRTDGAAAEWAVSKVPVAYPDAVAAMATIGALSFAPLGRLAAETREPDSVPTNS